MIHVSNIKRKKCQSQIQILRLSLLCLLYNQYSQIFYTSLHSRNTRASIQEVIFNFTPSLNFTDPQTNPSHHPTIPPGKSSIIHCKYQSSGGGGLKHSIQHHTANPHPKGPLGGPKMADGVWKSVKAKIFECSHQLLQKKFLILTLLL